MTNITRRVALGGLALLSAPVAAGHAAQLGLPQETLDAYRRASSPQERLEHHLLCAVIALDEIMGPAENCRWNLLGGGKPRSYDPWFRIVRYDRYRDFSEPRVPNGMDLERMSQIYERTGKRGFFGDVL